MSAREAYESGHGTFSKRPMPQPVARQQDYYASPSQRRRDDCASAQACWLAEENLKKIRRGVLDYTLVYVATTHTLTVFCELCSTAEQPNGRTWLIVGCVSENGQD